MFSSKILTMKTIQNKRSIFIIACFFLMISACRATPNHLHITSKSHSYKKDSIMQREGIIPKKQIEVSKATISDEARTQLIQEAREATKEKRYKDALNITKVILRERPNDETARFLNENAQTFLEDIRHKKAIEQIENVNVQERNKYFENLKEKTIPYNELMQFTTKDEWEGIKGRRQREDGKKRLEGNRENTRRLKLAPSPLQTTIP